MVCASASDESHGDKIYRVLNGSDDQVANEDLQDLGAQARPVLEGLLQAPDQEVTKRGANEGTVGGHLGHSGCEVVSMLVAILG